jgi:uncharacterized protein YyaL (SSP411 family)
LDEQTGQPPIAEEIDRGFIPVRIDRDERPDLDVRFQNALYAAAQRPGWPLIAFLTPKGEIFHIESIRPGDYPSFKERPEEHLSKIARFYREHRKKADETARSLHERLAVWERKKDAPAKAAAFPKLHEKLLHSVRGQYDPRNGGFGGLPRFPYPALLEYLLASHAHSRDPSLREMLVQSLCRMAQGPLHDAEEGGFYRCARDQRWQHPSKVKLLAENAQLARVYLLAFEALGHPLFRQAAEGIMKMFGTLRHPSGTGYANGRFEDGEDSSRYAGPQASAVRALLAAARVLDRPESLREGLKTLEGLLPPCGGKGEGEIRYLEYQATAALAAIEAYELTGEQRWLEPAQNLAGYCLNTFRAPPPLPAAMLDTPDAPLGPVIPIEDRPLACGVGLTLQMLAKLSAHTQDPAFRRQGTEILEGVGSALPGLSIYGGGMGTALLRYSAGT